MDQPRPMKRVTYPKGHYDTRTIPFQRLSEMAIYEICPPRIDGP
jgi:hypothetical protein